MLQDIARHAFRQLDSRVGAEQLDVADVAAADIAFISDSANDVTNFNAVITANFNAVQLHFANVATFATRTFAAFAVVTRFTRAAAVVTTIVTIAELTALRTRRIRLHDQRTFALRHFQQRSGQRFHIQLVLRRKFLQQRTILVQIAAFQLLLYASGEFLQATGAQQFGVRQFHFRNSQLHGALNVAQQTTLTVLDEQNGTASAARAACTTDTVHVRLGIQRDIVVNDQADTLNVQSTRRNVGCDQDIKTAIFQTFQRLLAQRLVHVAVQRRAVVTVALQRFGHFQRRVFSTHEDNSGIEIFRFQETHQRVGFTTVGRPVRLADVRTRRNAGLNAYFLRIFHETLGDATDRFRHGR